MLEQEYEPLASAEPDDHEPDRRERVMYHPLTIIAVAIAGAWLSILITRLLGI